MKPIPDLTSSTSTQLLSYSYGFGETPEQGTCFPNISHRPRIKEILTVACLALAILALNYAIARGIIKGLTRVIGISEKTSRTLSIVGAWIWLVRLVYSIYKYYIFKTSPSTTSLGLNANLHQAPPLRNL